MRITAADGGVLRSGKVVVVPYDPDSMAPDVDPVEENELFDTRRYGLYVHEPPPPKKVGIEKARGATQELDAELLDCLPPSGPIFEYVNWVVRLTHTPPQFHVATILPLIAYECCRRNYRVEPNEPLHLWTAIIAPPAIDKTTAVGLTQDFSKEFYETIHKSMLMPWCSLEGSLPGVVEALAHMHDETYDITPAILYHSELSRVLRAEDSAELLCLLYDTRDIERNLRYLQKQRDKGTEVKTAIRAPRVSAVTTSTRASMQASFKAHMVGGGLASRLFWFYTPAVEKEKLMSRQLVDEKGKKRVLESWVTWSRIMDTWHMSRFEKKVTLSPDAEELFDKFYDDDLRHIIADPENELASIAQRANGIVLRVAAIYAISMGALGIDEDCARRAIKLVKRSLKQSEVLLPQLSESQFGRYLAIFVDAISNAGPAGLTRRDQYKLAKNQPKALLDQIRETLVDAGFAVEIMKPATEKGGRPSSVIVSTEHVVLSTKPPALQKN